MSVIFVYMSKFNFELVQWLKYCKGIDTKYVMENSKKMDKKIINK